MGATEQPWKVRKGFFTVRWTLCVFTLQLDCVFSDLIEGGVFSKLFAVPSMPASFLLSKEAPGTGWDKLCLAASHQDGRSRAVLEDKVKSWIKIPRRDEVEEHSWEHPVLGFAKSNFSAGYKTCFRLSELRTAITERHKSATSQSSTLAEPNSKCHKKTLISWGLVRSFWSAWSFKFVAFKI